MANHAGVTHNLRTTMTAIAERPMTPNSRHRLSAGAAEGSGRRSADTIIAANAGPAEPMTPKPLARPKSIMSLKVQPIQEIAKARMRNASNGRSAIRSRIDLRFVDKRVSSVIDLLPVCHSSPHSPHFHPWVLPTVVLTRKPRPIWLLMPRRVRLWHNAPRRRGERQSRF